MLVPEGFARLTGQKQWLRDSERSGSLVRLKPKRFRFLNAEQFGTILVGRDRAYALTKNSPSGRRERLLYSQ